MQEINLREYGYFRVASAVLDMKVADVDYNLSEHGKMIRQAAEAGADLVLFPELSLTGYTAADLFYNQSLLEAAERSLVDIAEMCREYEIAAIVGLPFVSGGRLFNVATFVAPDGVKGIVPKKHLCNADEYYEERWFSCEADKSDEMAYVGREYVPFGADLIFEREGTPKVKIGIEICEDLWTLRPPSGDLAAAGCSIICNLSASNEYIGKTASRIGMVENQSKRLIAGYAYASSGPAESTTDTVFSGHSMIYECGELLTETDKYKYGSHLCIADIDVDLIDNARRLNNSFSASKPATEFRTIRFLGTDIEVETLEREYKKSPYLSSEHFFLRTIELNEIISLQKTALATRLRAINCTNVVVGLSGGLDSTLALLIIVQVFEEFNLDKSGIHVLTMPGFGTSDRTKGNADKLCEALGLECKTISIDKAVRLHFEDIGHDENIRNITYENAQARERTQILMDYANKVGGIVVGTGDMSEIALGWCTYNADQMSMYNVNAGVPKTLVADVVRYFSEEIHDDAVGLILKDIVDTPISPELLPPDAGGDIDQKTESTIGPYELHDFFLYHVLRSNFTPKKIVLIAEQAFKEVYSREEIIKWLKVFYRRFISQQFKRSAMPDGAKILQISLSPRGQLRMPSDASSALWLKEIEELEANK